MTAEPVEPPTRRDRLRAETVREIREAARTVLVEQGAEGLALRAVAREMGMTAPAIYRYFSSRDDLIEHLVADLYTELCDEMEAACAVASPSTTAQKLMTASRTFRAWAMAHRAEFGLIFANPATSVIHGRETHQGPAHEAGQRFGGIFGALIAELFLTRPFPVPADDELEPDLREQLADWCTVFPVQLPLGVMQVFLACWIRLYGMVSMEVFGHLQFALHDAEPMFEAELHRIGILLGVGDEYRRP